MPFHIKQTSAAAGQIASSPPVDVPNIVSSVIQEIRQRGDEAVRFYSEKFDKWSPESFKLTEEQIQSSIAKVPEQTIADIKTVQQNVKTFAVAQRDSLKDFELEIRPGVHLGQKNIPVNAVGA